MHYTNLFTTKNTEYASLLLSMNQTLESSYAKDGEYYFVFQNAIKCKKVVADLLNHRVIVDAKSLFEAIKTIKGMINPE
jgi:phosphoheptose isomerase